MVQVLINLLSVLNIFFIVLVVFFERKKPESTLAWVLVLFFLPYVGIFLYILFGEFFRFGIRKKERDKLVNDEYSLKIINAQIDFIEKNKSLKKDFRWLDLVLMNSKNAKSLVTYDNEIEIFNRASDKYDRLFKDIEKAKKSIHISYYIIRKDFYGKQLLDLLVKKVKEGVEVRLIFDHIGSKVTSKKFFKPLIQAGGKVEKFFPSRIFLKLYINHRNHRKLVIIDGEIGYVGGMNIGKEYVDGDKKITPWADRHVRIVGSGVYMLQSQFFMDYLFVSKEKNLLDDAEKLKKYFSDKVFEGKKLLQVVSSGPDYEESNIRDTYLKMINGAKESIVIETPYLILDESISVGLKVAATSGINVKIIIPGVPDKKMIYLATLSYARELMKYGVEVYCYNGFMHSKLLLVDDDIVCLGTANMDRRSFNLNFETNVVVYDDEFNKENKKLIEEDLKNSVLLKSKKNNFFAKIIEKLVRLFTPII